MILLLIKIVSRPALTTVRSQSKTAARPAMKIAISPVWVYAAVPTVAVPTIAIPTTWRLFYRASSALAVYAMVVCLSVYLSVCLSVTSRSSTKMAKRRNTQTTPHDSPGTLVF